MFYFEIVNRKWCLSWPLSWRCCSEASRNNQTESSGINLLLWERREQQTQIREQQSSWRSREEEEEHHLHHTQHSALNCEYKTSEKSFIWEFDALMFGKLILKDCEWKNISPNSKWITIRFKLQWSSVMSNKFKEIVMYKKIIELFAKFRHWNDNSYDCY